MTPERINAVIAEWHAINVCHDCGGTGWVTGMAHASDCDGNCTLGHCPVPTQEGCPHCSGGLTGPPLDYYYHDLNAIHEAFLKLDFDSQVVFVATLLAIQHGVDRDYFDKISWSDSPQLVNATAAQRCEALLRTIGRWEEA